MPPQGFGVRWDGGYEAGDTVSQYYDNLVGKLIVWGSDRDDRASAACCGRCDEFEIEGIATTIPADLAILAHPDFVDGDALDEVGRGRCSTCPSVGVAPATAAVRRRRAEPKVERDVDVEVNGKRFAVKVWLPDVGRRPPSPAARRRSAAPRRAAAGGGAGAAGRGTVTAPMQGTIVKVLVERRRRRSRPARPSACSRR